MRRTADAASSSCRTTIRIRDIADRVLWLEDGQFKEAVIMAVDPVCGMAVEGRKAVSAEWDGDTFYFVRTVAGRSSVIAGSIRRRFGKEPCDSSQA
jgi:putative ABC transport system ATP-binding protein